MQKTLIIIVIIVGVLVASFIALVSYRVYKNINQHKMAREEFDMSTIMQGQTQQTIEQGIMSLKYQQLLNEQDEERYRRLLTLNLESFTQHGTGDDDAFAGRITATASGLKDLMVHEQVISNLALFFRVANIEFGREHKLNFAEDVVNRWVSANLSFQVRLNMVSTHVTESTDVSGDDADDVSRNAIYTRIREKLLADIAKVKADSTMSNDAYQTLVKQSLQELDQMELKPDEGNNYSMVMLIPKAYYDLSKLLTADVVEPLTSWYSKHTAYTPPSFAELAQNIYRYLDYMKTAGFVEAADMRKLEKIVDKDMELFKSSSDSTLLTNTAIESLKRIEQIAGDTEDREVFAQLYCNMAHNKGFSIGKQVNQWMYGSPDTELEEELGRKMPWER